MPAGQSYGDTLRRARERSGVDVVTMARRLHVRPDILKAIENADFDRMPARGYSRNMVRAYARQLGIDEVEISERYLDEVHLYETGTPRSSSGGMRFGSGSYRSDRGGYGRASSGYDRSSSRRQDAYADSRSGSLSRSRTGSYPGSYAGSYAPSRDRYSSRDLRSSRPTYGSQGYSDGAYNRSRELSDRYSYGSSRRPPAESNSRNLQERSIRFQSGSQNGRRGVPKKSRLRDSDIILPQNQNSYADLYANNTGRRGAPSLNKPLLILIAVIALAVIIAVVVLFNSGTKSVEDIPDIPIAGFTDTSDPENTVTPTSPTQVAPTEATFTYRVEAGGRSWLEVTENGNSKPTFSGTVDGPSEETYNVTGTLTFKTANPTPIKVYVDGDEVKLSKSSKSDYYTYTVDFPSILAQWKAENDPAAAAASDSSAASSASSFSSSAATNTSASASTTRNASGTSNSRT